MVRDSSENASKSSRRSLLSAQDRLSHDIDTLKESFSQMRNDLSQIVRSAMAAGRDGKNVAGAKAVQMLSDAQSGAKGAYDDSIGRITDKIRENPGTSALIAFGAGYIVAKILRNR